MQKKNKKRKKVQRIMEKLKIKEAIVVEGRDDTAAVQKAVEALIIETHGYGISQTTWELLKKAYEEKGLIIFTDPDYSGEEIRRKVTARFPASKHAYMSRKSATRKGDVGIENATPQDIYEALTKVAAIKDKKEEIFTIKDLEKYKLAGSSKAKENRETVGKELGIGYGNTKTFLNKLNNFDVTREAFLSAVKKYED